MKTKKISKAYFNEFVASFVGWQEEFGLTQYDVNFFHEYLKDGYAEIHIFEKDKMANVFLTTKIEGNSIKADGGPQTHAKHEAIHLLLNRLRWLGEARYIEQSDLGEEWEALVRRLEKVL